MMKNNDVAAENVWLQILNS